MKRIIALLLCILIGCCIGCHVSWQNGQETKQSEVYSGMPVFFTFPKAGAYNFVYKSTGWQSSETTEFNKSKYTNDGQELLPSDKPVELKRLDREYYLLDGERYLIVKNPSPYSWPADYWYEWSVDKRFFYEYAMTNTGARLYKNVNNDSLDALVCITDEGDEQLLFRSASSFGSPTTYSIDDFGVIIFNELAFAWAADYKSVFEAHTIGKGATAAMDAWSYNINMQANITLECTSIPGLRYHMCAFIEDGIAYTYCRKKECIVSFVWDETLKMTYGQIWPQE